ncbi:hydrolase [Dyella mobilis]|uniref:Hydrolase n=1 Tax=Dyella mobilis TaxID=1849582 RepID=A0ABS2KAE4_9GAMM|nr:hydrolase [Dyella mobilis]MBM7128160.1 hydrolase [Dyella mobilis]GLQ99977.1 hydrolase [Dyella mobilis]
METLDPRRTALVLIDLQKGILPFAGGPHGPAEVLDKAAALVRRFHELKAPVVLVRVGWSADGGDAPHQRVDRPMPAVERPANWWEFPPELGVIDSDIRIVKRQWGAFYGTELELQLRRRGIEHIVLGGIATNIGVESTARNAWELGFGLVFAEDATSSTSAEHHAFAIDNIFPRLGFVRSTSQILEMLG